MQMDAGLDTGPMLLQQSLPITTETTAGNLHDSLADMGAKLILDALIAAPDPVRQTEPGATYAPKLSRESGRIDWNTSAHHIDRQVRAFDPWPGTFTTLGGHLFKILAVEPADGSGAPGTVIDDAFDSRLRQ